MTIGSLETARALHRHFNGREGSKPAPKGFSYVGAGCYRVVYLERATNTVYKLGNYDSNVNEAYMSRKLARKSTRSLGFELRIPKTRTFRVPNSSNRYGYSYPVRVVAQEYAGNARSTYCASQDDWMEDVPPCDCKPYSNICWTEVHKRVIEFSGLGDIHGQNILMDTNKVFWLIDMAD